MNLLQKTRRMIKSVFPFFQAPKRKHINFSYPISIYSRDFEKENIPVGGGIEVFDQSEAIKINQARMEHLESLNLPINGKSVLDVGCGIGHLAQFFVNKGCKTICVDGRKENIEALHLRYPDLTARAMNVETESLSSLGIFDIVFCYGLLYHLENPIAALRNMASVCRNLLLLETMVCDHEKPILLLDDENKSTNQALRGVGSRMTPSYVAYGLNRAGFPFVYAPRTKPLYQDFQFVWKNNLDISREGHPLRCVFIASKEPLKNLNVVNLIKGSK